jgi:hypothetical protein
MWPGKINHSVLEYRQSVDSGLMMRPTAIPLTERGSIDMMRGLNKNVAVLSSFDKRRETRVRPYLMVNGS